MTKVFVTKKNFPWVVILLYKPITNSSKHFGNNRWVAYSPKLQRTVSFYSDLEYDHWILIETDSSVTTFCEQPLKIQMGDTYSIFDMWVKRKDGSEYFVEIKYLRDLNPSKIKSYARVERQIATQREWCEIHGAEYKLITDKEIRGNPVYLDNMKLLLRYIQSETRYSELDKLRVKKFLQDKTGELGKLVNALGSRGMEILAQMYFDGMISSNLVHSSLNSHLEVHWNESQS